MGSRKLAIKLVRHGQSLANVDAFDPQKHGDFRTPLSPLGAIQAREAGDRLGREFLEGALVYASPYHRTRETLEGLLEGAGADRDDPFGIYEDPRLREQDHGYGNVKQQESLRATHGWFYYRYEGGESPADCFDRTSSFLESLLRQVERKSAERVLIVTHGLTLRCFVMRFLHLTVEQFDEMANPNNCDVVTLAEKSTLAAPTWTNGKWGVTGLSRRPPEP